MRTDSLPENRIVLGLTRVLSNVWEVHRDSRPVGEIRKTHDGQWVARRTRHRKSGRHNNVTCSSFRTAVLHVARLGLYVARVQDFGMVRMRRVEVSAGRWYTVIDDGKRGSYIYAEDLRERLPSMSDDVHAAVRLAAVAAKGED